MTPSIIKETLSLYQRLHVHNVHELAQVYSEHIRFTDPLHQIDGLPQLMRYMEMMYSNVLSIHFDYDEPVCQKNQAYVSWTMQLRHQRLNGGKIIIVPGLTRFLFDEKISEHRDYFDASAMIYEHIPVLGTAIRYVKGRLK